MHTNNDVPVFKNKNQRVYVDHDRNLTAQQQQ